MRNENIENLENLENFKFSLGMQNENMRNCSYRGERESCSQYSQYSHSQVL